MCCRSIFLVLSSSRKPLPVCVRHLFAFLFGLLKKETLKLCSFGQRNSLIWNGNIDLPIDGICVCIFPIVFPPLVPDIDAIVCINVSIRLVVHVAHHPLSIPEVPALWWSISFRDKVGSARWRSIKTGHFQIDIFMPSLVAFRHHYRRFSYRFFPFCFCSFPRIYANN